MAIEKEIIQTQIQTTGARQVQDDILKVNQAIKELGNEEKLLILTRNKLESQGKKNTEEWKRNEAAIKSNREAATKQREELGKLNGQLKITDMTYDQLRKRAAELRAQTNKVSQSLDSEKWHRYNNELQKTEAQMSKVKAGTNQTSSVLSGLTKVAGFLGLGLGSVWTAFKFGKSVIESTDATADKFEETIAGMSSGWDYFKKTIASGDWSFFFTNLREAIKAGKEYAKIIDDINDRENVNKLLTSDEIVKGKELELIWRDRTKNAEERKSALTDWQDMQKRAADREKVIAEDLYTAEVENISKKNDIDKASLEEALKNYEVYKVRREKLEQKNIFDQFKSWSSKIDESLVLKMLNLSPEDEKVLFMYKDFYKVSGDEREKIVEMYQRMRTAQGAVLDGQLESLRVEGQIEEQLGKTTEETENANKIAAQTQSDMFIEEYENFQKETEKLFKEANAKNLELIKKDELDEIQSDREKNKKKLEDFIKTEEQKRKFQEEYEKKRSAFLEEYRGKSAEELKQKELADLRKSYYDLLSNENATNQQLLDITETFEKAKADIEAKYRLQKLERIQEEVAQTSALFETGSEFISNLRDSEIQRIENDYARQIEMAGNNKNRITKLEEEKDKKIKEINKKYADSDFAMKIGQIIASTAQAAMSVWANNMMPYPAAAIFNGIMSAIITANGLSQASKARAERNKAKSLYTGGYTGEGDKYEPAGVVHKGEYVIASEELKIPTVRNMVSDIIEPLRMRRMGQNYLQSIAVPGYANGGPVSPISQSTDPRLIALLAANQALLNHLATNGVVSNFDETKIYEMRQRVAKQERGEALAKS